MNKTFEEQVKNQVQYPEYIEPYKNQKKLLKTLEKMNNMKKNILNKKKELNEINNKKIISNDEIKHTLEKLYIIKDNM